MSPFAWWVVGPVGVVESPTWPLPEPLAGPWPEPARIAAYYAKYERSLRDDLRSSAAEMASAFTTALRITPTRWRITP